MARCYLMVNDIEGSTEADVQFEFAFELGLGEGDPVPESVADMTPAQVAVWNMYNVLRGMVDQAHKDKMDREVGSTIVVPAGGLSH